MRSLERRLERIFESAPAKAFRTAQHPSELAALIARQADLARFNHPTGPATANFYTLTMGGRRQTGDLHHLEARLAEALTAYSAENGLRLEGPTQVTIVVDDALPDSNVTCTSQVSPGALAPWARLVSKKATFGIGANRSLVGRSDDSDIRLQHDDVSRAHALLWREQGKVLIKDLNSANGTWCDGVRCGNDPLTLRHGSVVNFATQQYRFLND